MDAREQALNLLNRIWAKLQNLPNANPIDLGAFVILLTFMRESRMSSATNHGYSSRIDHDTVCFLSGSGVPAHVGADLCNVLLLSQDQDERVKHLSKCASHSGNYSRRQSLDICFESSVLQKHRNESFLRRSSRHHESCRVN